MIAVAKSSQGLQKVRPRTKLSGEVVVLIRQAILAGDYASGEHLRLEALAQQLGTSVMPVREALIILAGEGLVAVLPRRGFVATPPDEQDWEDLFELQGHLAGILTRRAVLAATASDIALMNKIQSKIVDVAKKPLTLDTARELTALNVVFHRHINQIPKGKRARWFLRVTTRFTQGPPAKGGGEWLTMMVADHARIIAAFEARDVELAAQLMERHFADGSRLIAAQLPSLPSVLKERRPAE